MGGVGGVGFVGLDSFNFELASSLLSSGFKVQAFEISAELVGKFTELGGYKCESPLDVGKGLQEGAVLLLSSTISHLHLQKLEKQLAGCNFYAAGNSWYALCYTNFAFIMCDKAVFQFKLERFWL